MSDFPQWLVLALGSMVPLTVFVGFWMSLSSRLTKAEILAERADSRTSHLSTTFADYREHVAREYINRDAMRDMETRLTGAINLLIERFDRILKLPEK